MAEIVYSVAASLDGFIASEDGGVDWLQHYGPPDADWFRRFYGSIDAVLMGSKTYEFALRHGAGRSADKPTWVFTRRELPAPHASFTLTADDPSDVVAALDAQGIRRAWLMGGGRLATSFRQRGLISRYEIAVVPLLLGKGVPTFAAADRLDPLALVEVKPYANGIVLLVYENAPPGS